jgi:TPP-dependent indolepyruvate ferredoxin oxidoreductase alpha subunit
VTTKAETKTVDIKRVEDIHLEDHLLIVEEAEDVVENKTRSVVQDPQVNKRSLKIKSRLSILRG